MIDFIKIVWAILKDEDGDNMKPERFVIGALAIVMTLLTILLIFQGEVVLKQKRMIISFYKNEVVLQQELVQKNETILNQEKLLLEPQTNCQ
jgi:hypothetical protein